MRLDKLTTAFQQALADAQSAAVARDNPYVDLRLLVDADHFGLIDPTSDVWPEVRAAVAPFSP